jgi:hypothetical protein
LAEIQFALFHLTLFLVFKSYINISKKMSKEADAVRLNNVTEAAAG